jgi:hypothetical protein
MMVSTHLLAGWHCIGYDRSTSREMNTRATLVQKLAVK